MKVAVIYTGALRTIQKTINYFKKNVLLGPDVHVFACLQQDTLSSEVTETWIRNHLNPHLKWFDWFDVAQHAEWIIMREKNLTCTTISNHWKDYLRNSGSMIEYLQLYLAYKQIVQYEQTHGMTYDYIIRLRPDNLFAKPVDFHWLQWTEEDIASRINNLHQCMNASSMEITPFQTLRYFMNTLLDDTLLFNIPNIFGEFVPNKRVSIPTSPKEIHNYLHEGAYILTFRANNLYIVRRDLFYLIPCLFSMHGLLHVPNQDTYWFNAENQFQYACLHSGLAIHDYNTLFEDKSLYEYEESRYFDEDFRVKNHMMVYCLVRR
jgi:hypothetical protein